MSVPAVPRACDDCLARAWLLSRLASHLEVARADIDAVLGLDDGQLIEAVAGRQSEAVVCEMMSFDVCAARERCQRAGMETICRCQPDYPRRLHDLDSAPAVLHVVGGLERFLELAAGDPVAIVGSRRASRYGLEVAHSLGRGLGAASVAVVSGLALGVDSAAHTGTLDGGGTTIAVLPGAADHPYPASKRSLYRRLCATGVAVSELPPGSEVWRWMFPARNRVIAALAALTVVVEAGERSGALLTASIAARMGHAVGAVPGRVTAPLAAGPHGLLATGAVLIRDAQDALDTVFGAGVRTAVVPRPALGGVERELLHAIASVDDTALALARAGLTAEAGLAMLASLELGGYVRREPGGRWAVMP
jgi:DNA processing protein